MPHVYTLEQNYEDIADAIRAKLDVATTYKPDEMAAAIAGLIPAIGLENFKLFEWNSTSDSGLRPMRLLKCGYFYNTTSTETSHVIEHNLNALPKFFFVYSDKTDRSATNPFAKLAFMIDIGVDSYTAPSTLNSYGYLAARVALRKSSDSSTWGITYGTYAPSSGDDNIFTNITSTTLTFNAFLYSGDQVKLYDGYYYWMAIA